MATKKLGSKAAARKKLSAGAAAIRKAEAETKAVGSAKAKAKKGGKKVAPGKIVPIKPDKPEKVEIAPLTRDVADIVRERVTILPGSIGVALHEDTELNESLAIFDYVKTMQDHVGFMIGDVINFSEAKFGDKYKAAMAQTGRANSTLKAYAEVSRRIAPDQRVASLSFSHHREIIRLENPEKRAAVLKETKELAEKGKLPAVADLRIKVKRMQPVKARKNATRRVGKKAKGNGKVKEAYKPTPEEQSQIDAALSVVEEARAAIKDGPLQKLLLKIDNAQKKEWSKTLEPFEKLRFEIDKHTGY